MHHQRPRFEISELCIKKPHSNLLVLCAPALLCAADCARPRRITGATRQVCSELTCVAAVSCMWTCMLQAPFTKDHTLKHMPKCMYIKFYDIVDGKKLAPA